jgi:CubicO group peptidase (beta-lactamase class C family)
VLAARVVGVTLLVLLTLPALALAPPSDVSGTLNFSGIDDAANEAVASGEIPGVVVLIGRRDDILLQRAYGSRRLVPNQVPMTLDTIFDIASLTKPVGTTIAVMSLVERRLISLDAPLGRYLKEFQGKQFDEITIRRLLTHSAGLGEYPANSAVAAGFPTAAQRIARLPLEYPPGSGFQYSDTVFILLGEVVRRVAGTPLDRYLDRVLFRPLGLNDTTFRPRASTMSRVAPTEFANGHLLRGEAHDPRARLLGGVAGHAGMFSTAADLSRICRMLLNGGTLTDSAFSRPPRCAPCWSWRPTAVGRARSAGTSPRRTHGRSRRSSPRARWATPASPEPQCGSTRRRRAT